ncbi:MAG: hypothetical protein DME22_01000 [Verrucomicrobia bacterium]|nr:MAG: hypothetical protein DME22_01000 [Verrucomicrobiota bacterium]
MGVRLPIDPRVGLLSAEARAHLAAKACLRQFLGCCAATLLETEFRRHQIDYVAAILLPKIQKAQ